MTAAEKIVRLDIGGAKIKIPEKVVVRNFLESLDRQAAASTIVLSAGVPRIGEFWQGQGGVNAGLMRGENGQRDYYLIVPTHSDAYVQKIKWGSAGVDEPGAKSDLDGYANTVALFESGRDHPVAGWARELRIETRGDFYLPSRRELRLCWVNVPDLFEEGWYWSSTQYSSYSAWYQTFGGGSQGNGDKYDELRARAVRRLFI